ncbi:MAG: hypothetical protein M0Z31_07395 [Clostridia bacterium]|nr:hypothetical protein [Clostridia bacterium]
MYFWNVEKLAADLRENRLTQKDKMKYLVVFSVYYTVLFEFVFWSGVHGENIYDMPITNRFIVIFISFYSLYFIFGSLILGEVFDNFVQNASILDAATQLIFMISYYYYIKIYIAKIARSQ